MDFYFVNAKSILTLDEGMATPHRWYREKKRLPSNNMKSNQMIGHLRWTKQSASGGNNDNDCHQHIISAVARRCMVNRWWSNGRAYGTTTWNRIDANVIVQCSKLILYGSCCLYHSIIKRKITREICTAGWTSNNNNINLRMNKMAHQKQNTAECKKRNVLNGDIKYFILLFFLLSSSHCECELWNLLND